MPEGPAQAATDAKAAEAPIDDAKAFDNMNKMMMTLHLWDRPEAVFTKKSTTAAKTAATVGDFATKISKLQDDFGKALIKVAQDFSGMPFPEGSSLTAGWAAMLKQTSYTGNQYVGMARTIQTHIRGGIIKKIQPTTLTESSKKLTATLASAKKSQEKETETAKKCKAAIDKFKDQHKIAADDASWHETVAPQLKTKATELHSVHRQAEIAKAMADTVLQQTIQNSLDEFQQHDAERVQSINTFLSQMSDAQNKGLSASYKTGLATQRTIRSFQESDDLKEFCKANESGNSCPWIETIVTVGDDGKMSFIMQEKGKTAFSRKEIEAGQGVARDNAVVWQTTNKTSTKPHPVVNRARVKGTPGMAEYVSTVPKEHEISLGFSANFLPQMDVMSKSDPFVVLYIKDPVYETFSVVGRTETIMDDEDPHWGTKLTFDPKSPNDSLKLVVYDDDNGDKNAFMDLSKHDYIGEVVIHLDDFKSANPLTLPLKDKKGATVIKGKGCNSTSTITITASFRSAKQAERKPTVTAPPPPPTTTGEQKAQPAAVAYAKPEGGDDTTRGDYIPDEPEIAYGDGGLLTPIVIDNGSAYFKAGFSGDRLPSYVVPGVVVHFPPPFSAGQHQQKSFLLGAAAQHIGPGLCPDPKDLELNDMVFGDQPNNWDDVELMWEYLFNRLGVDIQDHPVLLTQPTLAPLALKKQMEEIMYEKFNCPAVYVAQAPLLSAYAYGHSSGLVVDVGHSSAQVIPIIDGYILDAHTRRVRHLGGMKDSHRIVQYFRENTDSEDPIEASRYTSNSHVTLMAQSIKDRMCACPASRDEYAEEMAVLQDVEGFLGGQDPEEVDKSAKPQKKRPNMLTLQKELITCGEVLFQPKELLKDNDASILSLQELCRDVAMACDLDTRRTLLSNIFLSGQVTTMPGFAERLTQEIRQTIPHAPYVRVYGEERRYATWTGGSVLTALDAFQDSWKFKADWEEERNKA